MILSLLWSIENIHSEQQYHHNNSQGFPFIISQNCQLLTFGSQDAAAFAYNNRYFLCVYSTGYDQCFADSSNTLANVKSLVASVIHTVSCQEIQHIFWLYMQCRNLPIKDEQYKVPSLLYNLQGEDNLSKGHNGYSQISVLFGGSILQYSKYYHMINHTVSPLMSDLLFFCEIFVSSSGRRST